MDNQKYLNFKFVELQDIDDTKALKYNAEEFTTHEGITDCAILVDENFVVIDIDDVKSALIVAELIKSHKIPETICFKTTRGYHLYFKKPTVLANISKQVDIPLACGIRADYLSNNGKKKIGAKFKENGIVRTRVDNSNIYNSEDLPLLPEYFYPIIKAKDSVEDLIALGEGDGRNNALFRHLGILKTQYPTFDEIIIEEIGKFINSNIFYTSLDDKEMSNLLKSSISTEGGQSLVSKLKGDFAYRDEKGKLDMDALVNDIVLNYELISYTDILYIKPKYTGEDYVRLGTELEIGRYFKDAVILDELQAKKLIFNLLIRAKEIDIDEGLPIRTKNNYEMRWDEDDFTEKQTSNFTMFNLDINYDPDAYDATVDKFLNHVSNNDFEIRTVIEEMMGHCLFTKHVPEFAYFIVSNAGETGKTTFLTMLEHFIGKDLTSSLSLDLMKEQHNIAAMSGKLLNIGDDIDATFLEVSNVFKSIVSGASLSGRNLYERTRTYNIISTLIFSANKMPRFRDVSGGIERRVVIIPCKNKVKEEDKDPTLQTKLASDNAKSYLLNLAIRGRKRLIANKNKLSYSEVIENETNEYLNLNNSMRSFVHWYDDDGIFLNLIISKLSNGEYQVGSPRELYTQYERHCEDGGFKAFFYKTFTSTIKDVYDVGVSKRDKFILFDMEATEENLPEIGRLYEKEVAEIKAKKEKKLQKRKELLNNLLLNTIKVGDVDYGNGGK